MKSVGVKIFSGSILVLINHFHHDNFFANTKESPRKIFLFLKFLRHYYKISLSGSIGILLILIIKSNSSEEILSDKLTSTCILLVAWIGIFFSDSDITYL